MANNSIIIRSEEIDFRVSGRRLTDFPNAGTYLSVEKLSNRATHIEGQHGTSTSVRNNGKSYRVTVTVMQGSGDDSFLAAAIAALDATSSVLGITLKYSGTLYASSNGDVEVVPTRELAADGSPMMVYAITGTFPNIIVASFGQPPVLTEDEIAQFQPNG